jgi:hypothetical protein
MFSGMPGNLKCSCVCVCFGGEVGEREKKRERRSNEVKGGACWCVRVSEKNLFLF